MHNRLVIVWNIFNRHQVKVVLVEVALGARRHIGQVDVDVGIPIGSRLFMEKPKGVHELVLKCADLRVAPGANRQRLLRVVRPAQVAVAPAALKDANILIFAFPGF